MKFLAFAAVCSIAAGAFAQKAPQLIVGNKRLVPICAYKVTKMYKDANGKIVTEHGPAIPYKHNEFNITRSTNLLYDAYEYDPATVATGLTPIQNPAYGADCLNGGVSMGGSRWFFGSGAGISGNYDDMGMVAGTFGNRAKRCGTGFYPDNGAVFANLALLIGTTDNWDTVTPGGLVDGGVNGRGDLDAWIFSYGPFTGTNFYYTTDLDTTDFGGAVDWGMPADGTGGYYIIGGDFDSGTNAWTVGQVQSMLWGGKPGNPSQLNSGDLFEDDNFNGLWDPTDFFNYAFGLCPDPLQTMVCFFGDTNAPVTLAPTSFSVGLGNTISGNVGSLAVAGDSNVLKLCKGFVPNFAAPRMRMDATYLSPYLTATSVQLDMNARMTTGGAFKIRGFLADTSGSGTFAYGVANQVIADTTIALAFANYSSGAVATGTHIDTDADATADGTIVARTEIQQTGFSAVPVPCSEWDSMTVTVTP